MERPEREANLRRRILGGDTSAWEEFYVESFDSLWIVLARRVGPDRSRIEDVAQETWLVAVRRIRRFDPELGSFRGWLHGIAENVIRNARRNWARREGATRRSLAEAEPVAAVFGAGSGAILEAHELVEASFASLPERYREVLRDKYVEELSVEEIAALRSASPKAVESMLGRARGAFREAYRILVAEPGDGRKGAIK